MVALHREVLWNITTEEKYSTGRKFEGRFNFWTSSQDLLRLCQAVQVSAEMFKWVQVRFQAGPLKNIHIH